jgi:hypothetical protein
MRKNISWLLVIFYLVIISQLNFSQETVNSPVGFSRKKLDDINISVLVPDGWYFKKQETKEMKSYFIAEEDISNGGRYETGMSIHSFPSQNSESFWKAVSEFNEKSGKTGEIVSSKIYLVEPDEYNLKKAQSFIELGSMHLFVGSKQKINIYQRLSKIKNPDSSITKSCSYLIYKYDTKTVYLIIFESPEAKWLKAVETGKVMSKIILHDKDQKGHFQLPPLL